MKAVRPIRPAEPTDGELFTAVAGGDLEALGAIFDRHAPELRRYLLRIGVAPADADDLIQATFLEVVHAARRFDDRQGARGFLFGVTMIMVRRHRRSVLRALARVASWGLEADRTPVASPADHLLGDEASRRLQRALSGLSSKKREVFVLVTLEGFSGEQAAKALGIPVKTVWTRLHHARRELRAALGESLR